MKYLIEIESPYPDLQDGENLTALEQHLMGFMGIDRVFVLSTVPSIEERLANLEQVVMACGLTSSP